MVHLTESLCVCLCVFCIKNSRREHGVAPVAKTVTVRNAYVLTCERTRASNRSLAVPI